MYGSASEFVREAIREKLERERERKEAKARLVKKLIEGLDGGESIEVGGDFFQLKKRAMRERAKQSKRG